MKTNTSRCLTALLFAGVGLSACQTIPSNYSASLADVNPYPANTSAFAPSFEGADAAAQEVTTDEVTAALIPSPRAKPVTAGDLLADVRPEIVKGNVQCVPFARDASGIDIRGNANRWWQLAAGKYARSRRPEEGAVFVMRGYHTARRGHVAVVREIRDSRTIVVDHANWGNDGRIYLNSPIRDESPKNDWSQVRVWHTPTGQWGSRLYRAKGFIYPTTAIASGTSALRSN